MADSKQNVNRHLNSAQQWLSQAEQAFDKDRDVRGELNLFLAQAELTHAREANRNQRWRHKYPLLRHGLAFGLAIAVAVTGVSASYWWGIGRYPVQPAPVAMQSAPVADSKLQQPITISRREAAPTSESKASAPANQSIPPAATGPVPVAVYQPVTTNQPVYEQPKPAPAVAQNKDLSMPPDELHKLIRSAEKSLRGQ